MQTSLFPIAPQLNSPSKTSLVGEISVSYKTKVKQSQLHKISSSNDGHLIFRRHYPKNTLAFVEQFKVLYLNRNNKVIGILHHSVGATAGTVVDIKIILCVALQTASAGFLLAHNHPSGNLKPGTADLALTKKIKAAAKLHDIELLDHLILTDESYFSFADNGMI